MSDKHMCIGIGAKNVLFCQIGDSLYTATQVTDHRKIIFL